MTKDKNRCANQILADMELFDFLKEKVGERKTKTGAYHDLLEKCVAGFVVPFLKNHEYVLQGYRQDIPRQVGGYGAYISYTLCQECGHYNGVQQNRHWQFYYHL